MPVNRRTLLGAAALGIGATALGGPLAATASAAPRTPAVAPLPDALRRLPAGSVTARGWLAGQLRLQLDGLCGRHESFSHFLDFSASGWVHPERGGWEEVPYWLRGYLPLAVATGDRTALARSRRWVDAVLATQQSDGFFGPRAAYLAERGTRTSGPSCRSSKPCARTRSSPGKSASCPSSCASSAS